MAARYIIVNALTRFFFPILLQRLPFVNGVFLCGIAVMDYCVNLDIFDASFFFEYYFGNIKKCFIMWNIILSKDGVDDLAKFCSGAISNRGDIFNYGIDKLTHLVFACG